MGLLSKASQVDEAQDAPEEPAAAPGAEAPAGSELETVRDLLFGAQLRDQQERVASHVDTSIADLRSCVDRKLQAFEDGLSSRLDKLGSRLDTEADQRLAGYAATEENAKKLGESLDAKLAEHRSWLETTVAALEERFRERDEALRAEVEERLREDRRAVGRALSALAHELAGDD